MKLTISTKPLKGKEIVRNWHLIDADGQILGRVASNVTAILQGKNKANYVPYIDCGDFVVVINASKIGLTGKKAASKKYTHYSGYPGGLRIDDFKSLLEKHPEKIIEAAVSGMLPKNKFRNDRLRRLFVFKDANHSYQAKFNKNSK